MAQLVKNLPAMQEMTIRFLDLEDPLVTQLVKNLPAMWETWVQPLGWKDPLEKGKTTHSSVLAWRIPWIKNKIFLECGF